MYKKIKKSIYLVIVSIMFCNEICLEALAPPSLIGGEIMILSAEEEKWSECLSWLLSVSNEWNLEKLISRYKEIYDSKDKDKDKDIDTEDVIWGYYVEMLIEAIRKEENRHYLSVLLKMDNPSLVQEVREAISTRIRECKEQFAEEVKKRRKTYRMKQKNIEKEKIEGQRRRDAELQEKREKVKNIYDSVKYRRPGGGSTHATVEVVVDGYKVKRTIAPHAKRNKQLSKRAIQKSGILFQAQRASEDSMAGGSSVIKKTGQECLEERSKKKKESAVGKEKCVGEASGSTKAEGLKDDLVTREKALHKGKSVSDGGKEEERDLGEASGSTEAEVLEDDLVTKEKALHESKDASDLSGILGSTEAEGLKEDLVTREKALHESKDASDSGKEEAHDLSGALGSTEEEVLEDKAKEQVLALADEVMRLADVIASEDVARYDLRVVLEGLREVCKDIKNKNQEPEKLRKKEFLQEEKIKNESLKRELDDSISSLADKRQKFTQEIETMEKKVKAFQKELKERLLKKEEKDTIKCQMNKAKEHSQNSRGSRVEVVRQLDTKKKELRQVVETLQEMEKFNGTEGESVLNESWEGLWQKIKYQRRSLWERLYGKDGEGLEDVYWTLNDWNNQEFQQRKDNQEKVRIALQKMYYVMWMYPKLSKLSDSEKISVKKGVGYLLNTFWNTGIGVHEDIRRDVVRLLEMYGTMKIQTEDLVFQEYVLESDVASVGNIKAFERKLNSQRKEMEELYSEMLDILDKYTLAEYTLTKTDLEKSEFKDIHSIVHSISHQNQLESNSSFINQSESKIPRPPDEYKQIQNKHQDLYKALVREEGEAIAQRGSRSVRYTHKVR